MRQRWREEAQHEGELVLTTTHTAAEAMTTTRTATANIRGDPGSGRPGQCVQKTNHDFHRGSFSSHSSLKPPTNDTLTHTADSDDNDADGNCYHDDGDCNNDDGQHNDDDDRSSRGCGGVYSCATEGYERKHHG